MPRRPESFAAGSPPPPAEPSVRGNLRAVPHRPLAPLAPLAALLLALAAATPARAQEELLPEPEEPPMEEPASEEPASKDPEAAVPEPPWSGSLGVSYLATGGNSESETFGADFEATRRPEPWGVDLVAAVHDAETDGDKTAERSFATLRLKRALTERWELFGGVSGERDVFADLDLRLVAEAGVIYKALLGPPHALGLDLGLTWTDEDRVEPEPDTESFGAVAGIDYEWRIGPNATFSQRLIYHPNFDRSTDWRAVSLTALAAAINKRLSVKLGYERHYRNEPIGDNDDIDTLTKMSLVWRF
jgi:putative salt-induced outer membrane protein YdiY